MKKWLKRIRGAVGLGLTWGAAWSALGAVLWLAGGTGPLGLPDSLLASAILGFVGGAIFSTVLGITEGRRRFDEMSLLRFAGWGALGGVILTLPYVLIVFPGALLVKVIIAGILALIGAGSAAGSLALARRADDRELLEHGADVADIGLTEEEKRELLTE